MSIFEDNIRHLVCTNGFAGSSFSRPVGSVGS